MSKVVTVEVSGVARLVGIVVVLDVVLAVDVCCVMGFGVV